MNTSKQIVPNQLEVAKKQMSKFIDKINVPTGINESDKGFFHVLIVDATFNQALLEANYSARVQIFDVKSWLSIKDNLKQIGVQNAYIIHDPTITAKEVKTKSQEPNGNENKTQAKGGNTGADAGAGDNANKGDGDTGEGGNDADKDVETPKEKRAKLIQEAKELGYEGNLNAKNSVFEEFIENAKTNGANANKDANQ